MWVTLCKTRHVWCSNDLSFGINLSGAWLCDNQQCHHGQLRWGQPQRGSSAGTVAVTTQSMPWVLPAARCEPAAQGRAAGLRRARRQLRRRINHPGRWSGCFTCEARTDLSRSRPCRPREAWR